MVIDGDYYAGATSEGPSKVWHAGNFNPNNYISTSGGIITSNEVGLTIKRTTTYPIISYYGGNTSTQSFYGALGFSGSNSPCYVDNTGRNSYTLIHTNNIGSYNSGSATKLATPRTIWGQSFNGESNEEFQIGQNYLYCAGGGDGSIPVLCAPL
jgi:hypothetical protein